MKKRIFSLLLALSLVISTTPEICLANVSTSVAETTLQDNIAVESSDVNVDKTVTETSDADTANTTSEASEHDNVEFVGPFYQTYINPMYADVITEEDLLPLSNVMTLADTEICETIEEAGAALREYLKARQESFSITVKLDEFTNESFTADCKAILTEAFRHTGEPTEGDYIERQYGGYRNSANAYVQNGKYIATITYTATYYTTAEQEAEMDSEIEKVLDSFAFTEETTDYEKVCEIYDYICENITYDYTNLEDDSYLLKYTAYAALINKTSVCQGYAVLFYRMALEEGIDARYIRGIGNGGSHGWNIVELDGLYYNLDATWDAQRAEVGYSYAYFLKCESNFGDHTRNEAYTTDEFYAAYPAPDSDYTVNEAAVVSVTVDDWVYGDTAKTPKPVSATNGTDNVTYYYKAKNAEDSAYTETVPTDAGAYTVKAVFAATDTHSRGIATDDFTILPKTITVTINNQTRPYKEENPTLTYAVSEGALVGTDTEESLGIVLSTMATVESNAGNYDITGTYDSDNYQVSFTKGVLTVTKLDGKVTVPQTEIADKQFGDEDFTVTAEALGGGILSYEVSDSKNAGGTEVSDDGVITVDDNGTVSIKGAGSATIVVNAAESTNYKAATENISVTVAKKPVTESLTEERSFIYTVGSKEEVVSINVAALLPDDRGETTYSGSKSGSIIEEGTILNSGVISFTVGTGNMGDTGVINVVASSENYEDITYTLTVTLEEKYSVSLKEDSQVIVSDRTDGAGTELVYGESISKLTLNDSGENAAEFVNFEGEIIEGTLAWEDETIVPGAGTFTAEWVFTPADTLVYKSVTGTTEITVLPKPVTVTIDNQTRKYKEENPVFTYSVEADALVGDDTKESLGVTLQTKAVATSNVGTYDITGSSTSKNYNVTFNKGTLTITQADGQVVIKNNAITKGLNSEAFALALDKVGDGEFSYEVTESKSVSGNTVENDAVVTVDETGKVSIVGIGSATITVTLSETTNYKAATGQIEITVVEQYDEPEDTEKPGSDTPGGNDTPGSEKPQTPQEQNKPNLKAIGATVDAGIKGAAFVVTNSGTFAGNKIVGAEVSYKSTNTKATSIKIPDTINAGGIVYAVTSIASSGVKNHKKLKTVKMGSNLKTIGANAFSGCKKLTSVTIGKNVTKIDSKAFYKCTALKKVTIPKNVTQIGKQAFSGCKSLKTITIKSTKLTKVGSKAINGIHKKAVIKVPKKKLKVYKKLFKSKTGFKKTMKIK